MEAQWRPSGRKTSRDGTALKTSFTIRGLARYGWCMIGIAAAALLAAAPQGGRAQSSAVVQARATVRIFSGTRLKLAEADTGRDTPRVHNATIRTNDGPQAAKLIEFE